jgi:hypothetical protein
MMSPTAATVKGSAARTFGQIAKATRRNNEGKIFILDKKPLPLFESPGSREKRVRL